MEKTNDIKEEKSPVGLKVEAEGGERPSWRGGSSGST